MLSVAKIPFVYLFNFPVPKILLAFGPWRAFGLTATSLPIGPPMRAAHAWYAKTLGLGPAQNNLRLSFSSSDSARTGDQWLVPVIVQHNNSTPAQSKSLIVPKNFPWPEDPPKNSELNFLGIRGQCKKFNLNSRRGM